jgi:adenylosuccinate lyase
VESLARFVRADADLATQAMIHGHERDGRSWKSEWVLLPEACLYAGVSVASAVSILECLEVDTDRMRRNLDAQRGYVMSEPVMRALADRVGKHTAHRIVYEAALAGREADVDLRSALRADHRLADLDDEELDRLLDPRNTLGSIPQFIDRVLASDHA